MLHADDVRWEPTEPRATPTTAPAPLAALLVTIQRFIQRYVVLTEQQAVAVTLWIIHTHVIEAFDCTPYLEIWSATKRAGKTRLLEVLELIVARAWFTGRTSAAALVRKTDADCPTLLLDESDASFGGDKEYAETLRGVLNSGYRRSGRTTLCVGQGTNLTFRDFSTFGPKAIAGIGELPATIADRAIPIALKRRTSDEPVERFRERNARAIAAPITAGLLAWIDRAVPTLRAARPTLPAALNDRAQDVWEPLLAIAELAGGPWPDRAKRAAVALMADDDGIGEDDIRVELLQDTRDVFTQTGASFIASGELVTALCGLDDRPWATWRKGQPLSGHTVARLLRGFGIVPRQNASGAARGYHRERFEDAWSRYPRIKVSDCQNPNETGATLAFSDCQDDSGSDTLELQKTPMNTGSSDTLTLGSGDTGAEEDDSAAIY